MSRNKKWKTEQIPNCRNNVKIQSQNRRNRDKSTPLTQIYDDIHLKSTWPHIHFELLNIQVETCSILTHFIQFASYTYTIFQNVMKKFEYITSTEDQIIYIVMSDRGPRNQYSSDTSSIKNNVRWTLCHI